LRSARNEDDGCQIVEAAEMRRTFHPFVRGTTHIGAVPTRNPTSNATTRRAEAFQAKGKQQ